MQKHSLNENSFEGGVGGFTGTVNTQASLGTFASPEASQNSHNFAHSDNNKSVNQHGNTRKDAPGTGSLNQDVNAVFAKGKTPTPDEVAAGIKYELGQQIKKDKYEAKKLVMTNLRKDPKFYSGLKMLNIDDESMVKNMSEQKHPNDKPMTEKVKVNTDEAKKIFAEMAQAKDNKYVVNSGIVDVMQEMWEAKRQRSAWKNGNA
jgi:hypothetical protein